MKIFSNECTSVFMSAVKKSVHANCEYWLKWHVRRIAFNEGFMIIFFVSMSCLFFVGRTIIFVIRQMRAVLIVSYCEYFLRVISVGFVSQSMIVCRFDVKCKWIGWILFLICMLRKAHKTLTRKAETKKLRIECKIMGKKRSILERQLKLNALGCHNWVKHRFEWI